VKHGILMEVYDAIHSVAYPGFCERRAPLGGLGDGSPLRGPGAELLVSVWGLRPQKLSDFCKY